MIEEIDCETKACGDVGLMVEGIKKLKGQAKG